MEPNFDIASASLREIVAGLCRTGLPIPTEDPQLTEGQNRALQVFSTAVDIYNEFCIEGKEPQEGTPWWDAIPVFRTAIQAAIEAGLIQFAYIQKAALNFGAIPDPDTNWKYYVLPTGDYACWHCGSKIQVKVVHNSVHFRETPMAGGGEVRRSHVPYCLKCDREPRDGIIQESLVEALERDGVFRVSRCPDC